MKPHRPQLIKGALRKNSRQDRSQKGVVPLISFCQWKNGALNLLRFVARVLCIAPPGNLNEGNGAANNGISAIPLNDKVEIMGVALLILPGNLPASPC